MDTQGFKDALSRFASGVTVVTTHCDGSNHGLTVSAFTSVSMEPPMVLICLDEGTDSLPLIERSGVFAVHILGKDDSELGTRFARGDKDQHDPFEGLTVGSATTGSPILEAGLAWLDCTVHAQIPAGDHRIILGAVQALSVREGGEPVLYYDRDWRTLA